MGSPFLTRVRRFPSLTDDDIRAISEMAEGRPRILPARSEISHEGSANDTVRIIRQGWACRYRSLADGRRQILSFMLPGDVCCLASHVPSITDHTLAAVSGVAVTEFPRTALRALASERPTVGAAFGWMEAATLSIQREWTLGLGQRNSNERLAHLLCETFHRLRSVGMADASGFVAPVTQGDVAEAIGLSNVHVSRTLKDLREMGLVRAKGRLVTILDMPRLEAAAAFEPGYLMLEPRAWVQADPDPDSVPGYS